MRNSEDGLVIVYTGAGKGKTTAALGLALRAIGHGRRVLLVQFLKGQPTGELAAASQLPGFRALQAGRAEFVNLAEPAPADREAAAEGLRVAAGELRSGGADLVILDEVNVAAGYGLLSAAEVLEAIRERAAGVDVVLTGRAAPQEFIDAADLVTEMREIKHPYQVGRPARAGLEY